jgi:hypothetical protein
MWAAGTVCNPNPSCSANNAAIIPNLVCNGTGACIPGTPSDCKGYLCTANVCTTSCTSDAGCAPSAFCSAGRCILQPVNLAGNGDGEYGTTAGWKASFDAGSPTLSNSAAHAGSYSVYQFGRTNVYQGPAYIMPTGAGKYYISMWVMQTGTTTFDGVAQYYEKCATQEDYVAIQPTGFGMSMPTGAWVQFAGTIDSATPFGDPGCLPTAAAPGAIASSFIYVNNGQGETKEPDLYMDDVVVQVTDGHNLVGNPNFETGSIAGWGPAGALTLSTTVAASGMYSLQSTGRSASTVGPTYALPIGAARYSVSLKARHSGTNPHDLVLQPTYTCLGGSAVTPPPIAIAAATPGGTWTTLIGNVTFPPANAAANCRLTQAAIQVQQEAGICSAIECPDLFVDDVSITLTP